FAANGVGAIERRVVYDDGLEGEILRVGKNRSKALPQERCGAPVHDDDGKICACGHCRNLWVEISGRNELTMPQLKREQKIDVTATLFLLAFVAGKHFTD